jgi:hypothetical protein
MDPDEVVIEYIRGKLKGARAARADSILKPPAEVPAEAEGEDPEQMAQLEALMQESPGEAESPVEDMAEGGEPCPECGVVGGCEHTKAM